MIHMVAKNSNVMICHLRRTEKYVARKSVISERNWIAHYQQLWYDPTKQDVFETVDLPVVYPIEITEMETAWTRTKNSKQPV